MKTQVYIGVLRSVVVVVWGGQQARVRLQERAPSLPAGDSPPTSLPNKYSFTSLRGKGQSLARSKVIIDEHIGLLDEAHCLELRYKQGMLHQDKLFS